MVKVNFTGLNIISVFYMVVATWPHLLVAMGQGKEGLRCVYRQQLSESTPKLPWDKHRYLAHVNTCGMDNSFIFTCQCTTQTYILVILFTYVYKTGNQTRM